MKKVHFFENTDLASISTEIDKFLVEKNATIESVNLSIERNYIVTLIYSIKEAAQG